MQSGKGELTAEMSLLDFDYESLFIEGWSGPPLSEADLNDFEQTFGRRIPTAYRTFLRRCNGGILRRQLFHLPPNYQFFILYFLGIGNPFYQLIEPDGQDFNRALIKSWRLPEDIFIFSNMGHSFFFLKYDPATEDQGPVFYVCTEIPGAYEYFQLADSLEEFMLGLETNSHTKAIAKHYELAVPAENVEKALINYMKRARDSKKENILSRQLREIPSEIRLQMILDALKVNLVNGLCIARRCLSSVSEYEAIMRFCMEHANAGDMELCVRICAERMSVKKVRAILEEYRAMGKGDQVEKFLYYSRRYMDFDLG